MNDTSIPSAATGSGDDLRGRLSAALGEFPPELRKAAVYILEHPTDVGVGSIHEAAAAAGVKPNSLVRVARAVGVDGYAALRDTFREELRQADGFPDRARWLQSIAKGGRLASLHAAMAEQSIANLERLFASVRTEDLQAVAKQIVRARSTFVLGVGTANSIARNFAYLAGMAVDNVECIPRDGVVPVDDLVRAGPRDVLIAMTFKPYRREVVDAVQLAAEQRVRLVAVSDSPAAPIMAGAAHTFVVPTETPQFFTSTVALAALFETLIAFVIAETGDDAVATIERFHARRQQLGVYWSPTGGSP